CAQQRCLPTDPQAPATHLAVGHPFQRRTEQSAGVLKDLFDSIQSYAANQVYVSPHRSTSAYMLETVASVSGSTLGMLCSAVRDSTIEPSLRVRLPAQPGPLVGRADDVLRITHQVLREDVRLLTLVGAAGTGKTRLALEVASQLAEHFGDGTWFVDLSPVRDPDLVPSAIAAKLKVREDRDRPLIETLK